MTPRDMAEAVLRSRKYQGVHPAVVEGICREESARHKKPADALKAVKRRLHIMHAAYAEDGIRQAEGILSGALGGDPMKDRQLSLRLLPLHRSTRERLPSMEPFYAFIAQEMGQARSVLDVGCGFHPFALPWMAFPTGTSYVAMDINDQNAALLNRYFAACSGMEGSAQSGDATKALPEGQFDFAFLLKLLPVLEQQGKGSAKALLEALPAQTALVSFPSRSLSGKDRGMRGHYAQFLEDILPDALKVERQAEIGNELLYVLRRV